MRKFGSVLPKDATNVEYGVEHEQDYASCCGGGADSYHSLCGSDPCTFYVFVQWTDPERFNNGKLKKNKHPARGYKAFPVDFDTLLGELLDK